MALALKPLLKSALVSTPLRHLAAPVHDRLVDAELWAFAALDQHAPHSTEGVHLERVTAIIKTFERPRMVERLVQSAKRLWPALRIVVADDSHEPRPIPGVELVPLPFDSGVSAGRKAALERVNTEFTWLLDDDFVLYSGSRLDLAVRALDQYAQVDLVAGPVIFLPLLRKVHGNPTAIFHTERQSVIAPGTRIGKLTVRDKVPNFYLARTQRLRLVSWTPELKRVDHADFFTRAKGTLVSAFSEEFRVLHAQTPFDAHYQRFRQDYDNDREVLRARYGS